MWFITYKGKPATNGTLSKLYKSSSFSGASKLIIAASTKAEVKFCHWHIFEKDWHDRHSGVDVMKFDQKVKNNAL